MPSQKNINQVKNLQEKLGKAKSLVLADFRGLTMQKQQELANEIKKTGGELTVAKNRLLKIAMKKTEFRFPKNLAQITGPTITLFCFKDEIAPIKVLYNFAQKNQIPEIKFGFMNHDFLEKEAVEEIAQLPSRGQLHARLVGLLSSPLQGTVYVLKGNLRKLVMTLEKIKSKKS